MAHVHTKKEYNILGWTHQELLWLRLATMQRVNEPQADGVPEPTPEEIRFLTKLRTDIEREIRFTGGTLSAKDV